jgi:hypothetical protein
MQWLLYLKTMAKHRNYTAVMSKIPDDARSVNYTERFGAPTAPVRGERVHSSVDRADDSQKWSVVMKKSQMWGVRPQRTKGNYVARR